MSDLRKLAEAATPGPWSPTKGHPSLRYYGVHCASGPIIRFHGMGKANTGGHDNAAYIAAANPAAILALLDERDALREAFVWAMAELNGETHYETSDQQQNARRKAADLLTEIEK